MEFNAKDLESIRTRLKDIDEKRETLIKDSRKVIKLSKEAIALIHRSKTDEAKPIIEEMSQGIKELQKITQDDSRLKYLGAFKAAEQEYVEAACFMGVMSSGIMPPNTELKVNDEHYLLGLCDLTGELARKAINSVIQEEFSVAKEIHSFVVEIYDELSKFDFLGGELRKKYDSIKYDLRRIEDVILQLKVKEKI